MTRILTKFDYAETASHSIRVAKKAREISESLNFDETDAYLAGLLHDISVIIPDNDKVALAEQSDLLVYPEEKILPMILHQRLSKIVAMDYFGVENISILNAIEYHTTLRKNPSQLDLILFVADKIEWDQKDRAPYLDGLLQNLSLSVEDAALYYINWILAEGVTVMHPWLVEAKHDLDAKPKKSFAKFAQPP